MLTQLDLSIALSIARIRAYKAAMNCTRRQLAKDAGLAHNTLKRFNHSDWSPSPATLRKLLAVIPDSFRVPKERPAQQAERAA